LVLMKRRVSLVKGIIIIPADTFEIRSNKIVVTDVVKWYLLYSLFEARL